MKFLGEFLLKRKKSKLTREVYFKNLESTKTALIIYDCTDKAQSQKVRDFIRYFKEERLQVDSIGYFSKLGKNVSKPADENNFYYYDRKDLNAYKFPKRQELIKLIKKQHDLMIDLNLKANFSLKVLSSLSNAKFKVGPNHQYGNETFD